MRKAIQKITQSKIARRVMTVTPVLAIAGAPAAFAADPANPSVKIDSTAVTTAVSGAVSDTIALMTSLLPYALTIFAAIWGVKKAMRFFKGAAN